MKNALVFILIFLSCSATANTPPIEYFLKDSDYLDVLLSPSGAKLAARARIDGKVVLIVIDRETKRIIGGLQPEDGDAISSFQWATEERIVYSYAEQLSGSDQRSSFGELYAVNYDGSDPTILAGFRAAGSSAGTRVGGVRKSDRAVVAMLDVLPNDDEHVLIMKIPFTPKGYNYVLDGNRSPIVAKLNIRSGKQKTVERLPFKRAQPFTDKNGDIRFVTYQSETGDVKSSYRATLKDDWKPISAVFRLDDDLSVVGLNAEGNAVFLYGPFGENGYRTVFRYDFAEGTYEALFTKMDADIVDWVVEPQTGEVVIGSSRRGKTKHHYTARASHLQPLHKALVQAYGDQTLSIMSSSVDGEEMILHASSDINPGSIYIFNVAQKRAEFFWGNRSWMNPAEMQKTQIDEVVTSDGFAIPVRLTLPSTDEGPVPLIINPHGGPHGISDDWAFNYETQLFASRGFAVLQMNFRGSGGLGKRFEEAGYRQWGGRMIEDISAAASWAMSKGYIDQSSVCAYGASYGAYAAYMLAIREPEVLRCVAGYVGVYDLNLMYSTGDVPESWGGTAFLERVIGRQKSELDDFSPVTHASTIDIPSMIIHGEDDNRAPIEHAYALRAALEESGKTPVWLKLDDSGHGAGNLENRVKLYNGLLEFFERNLKK